MTDIEAIVEGLSAAQRAWLVAAEPTLEDVPKTPCAEWWDHPEALYVEIDEIDHWLGCKRMNSPEGASTFTSGFERLTELGLQVRAHLLQNP